MPEVHVRLRWPDGSHQLVYSPSLVVTDYLAAGASYPVADLVPTLVSALGEASERVRAAYGFPCSRAAASIAAVRASAAPFAPDGSVTVESFD